MNVRELMIALAAVAIAMPAAASPERAPDQTAKVAPKKQQTASNGQLYCISYDDLVGSRVRQQECKTKAKWAEQGVDVEHPDASSRG
jgi:predicted alpha/beta hydrolase family esterase